MPTTFRSDLVAAFSTIMAAFIVAHPTVVVRHFRHRPPNLAQPTPFTYLDLRPEAISHDHALRTRLASPSIVLVDQWTEAGEVMDRLDDAVDLLLDTFTANYSPVANSIWIGGMTITDEEIDGHPCVRFTFEDIEFKEGRQ